MKHRVVEACDTKAANHPTFQRDKAASPGGRCIMEQDFAKPNSLLHDALERPHSPVRVERICPSLSDIAGPSQNTWVNSEGNPRSGRANQRILYSRSGAFTTIPFVMSTSGAWPSSAHARLDLAQLQHAHRRTG